MKDGLREMVVSIILMQDTGNAIASLGYTPEEHKDVLFAGFITALRQFADELGEELHSIVLRDSIYHLFKRKLQWKIKEETIIQDVWCAVQLKGLVDKSLAYDIAERVFTAYKILKPTFTKAECLLVNHPELVKSINNIVSELILELGEASLADYIIYEGNKLIPSRKAVVEYIKSLA